MASLSVPLCVDESAWPRDSETSQLNWRPAVPENVMKCSVLDSASKALMSSYVLPRAARYGPFSQNLCREKYEFA